MSKLPICEIRLDTSCGVCYECKLDKANERILELEDEFNTAELCWTDALDLEEKHRKKLKQKDERILELEKILGDFISTTECKREWVDEMQATIESVLEQHIGEE